MSAKRWQLWVSWIAFSILMTIFARTRNEDFVHDYWEGHQHVFVYQLWVTLYGVLIAGIGARLIWLLRDSRRSMISVIGKQVAACGILMGVFCLLLFPKCVVKVSPTGFYISQSFCGMKVHDVDYGDLTRIRLLWREYRTKNGHDYSYYLQCERKDGSREKIEVSGDRVMRIASKEMIKNAKDQGVPISKPHGAHLDQWFAEKRHPFRSLPSVTIFVYVYCITNIT